MSLTLHTNLKAGAATTQLAGFDFNSYCRFAGHRLACRSGNLCAIGGSLGVVEPSASFFRTFNFKLGYDGNKRAVHWYLGVETQGKLKITPYFNDVAGRQITVSPSKLGKQFLKVGGCCDEEGAYVRLEVENVNACWFAIDRIAVLPMYLPRGR
jgi:hypothetical protein